MRAANFIEEAAASIAGTNGNGAVTLAPIAGKPRLSNAFGVQATTFRYVVEEPSTGKIESGIGSVANNVLTRTKPQVTWDGTTYQDGRAGTVAPLAFGSTPAAGTVLIRTAPLADGQGAIMSAVQQVASPGGWSDFIYCAANGALSNNGTGIATTANRIYYQAYKLERSGVLQGIAFDVMTAAGTGMKLALYSIGPNGLPDCKIVDFNLIATTTTGIKSDTVTSTWVPAEPVYLTPGWYVTAWISDGAVSLRGNQNAGNARSPTPFGQGSGYGYSQYVFNTGTYASGLPAVADMNGVSVNTSNGWFWIGLRVRA